jgi:hypothetical protein
MKTECLQTKQCAGSSRIGKDDRVVLIRSLIYARVWNKRLRVEGLKEIV